MITLSTKDQIISLSGRPSLIISSAFALHLADQQRGDSRSDHQRH